MAARKPHGRNIRGHQVSGTKMGKAAQDSSASVYDGTKKLSFTLRDISKLGKRFPGMR
jgi:hypothetical protein